MRTLLLSLLLAPLLATANDLDLVVRRGDTVAAILIRNDDVVRLVTGLDGGTKRTRAYRLIKRSGDIDSVMLRAGDHLLVSPAGRVRWQRPGAPTPTPCPPAQAPPPPPSPLAPAPPPVAVFDGLDVLDSGHRARIGRDHAEITTTPELTLFDRDGALHIVRVTPPAFDVAIPVDAATVFSIPDNSIVRLVDGRLRPAEDPLDDPTAYVHRGELNVHDDHLHLTGKFPHPSWKALYAAREDGSPEAPQRRQVAMVVIIKLLDVHIGLEKSDFRASLDHTLRLVDRLWDAFQRGVEGNDLVGMVAHDYAISPDGRRVTVGEDVWLGAGDVRFETCREHFHVYDGSPARSFAQPVEIQPGVGAVFAESPFYARRGNFIVATPAPAEWKRLLDNGGLARRNGHYHLTTSWPDPALQRLRHLSDHAGSHEARDLATSGLLAVLSSKLEPQSEADFLRLLGEASTLAASTEQAIRDRASREGWDLGPPIP